MQCSYDRRSQDRAPHSSTRRRAAQRDDLGRENLYVGGANAIAELLPALRASEGATCANWCCWLSGFDDDAVLNLEAHPYLPAVDR
jgi:hypothetical protein